jgi:GDPmannose 4,6-dehydratase
MSSERAAVVILGASGQDGPYLAAHHQQLGDRVLSFSRRAADPRERLDVSDRALVTELIRREKPGIVYQLAAVSTTRHEALWDNQAAIATGTLNVLEAVHHHSRATRVMVIGSALQFENKGEPIDETTAFEASSAYAVARIQAVYAARFYRSLGLKAYVGYLFHHDSPLRTPPHVSARICHDIAAIARGELEHLDVGDPTVEKEWGYAGDVAAGLAILVQQDEVFEAVVGTGEAHSIGEWVERCFASLALSSSGRVRAIPGFKAEYRRIVSRPDTLRSLAWSPRVGFEELASRMMTRAVEMGGASAR